MVGRVDSVDGRKNILDGEGFEILGARSIRAG